MPCLKEGIIGLHLLVSHSVSRLSVVCQYPKTPLLDRHQTCEADLP